MPNKVTTRDSTPEISSHAKALPAPFERERNPDRPHPVCCRAIAFLLLARMISETASLIIKNCNFDVNARRCLRFRSDFNDIEFRLIEISAHDSGTVLKHFSYFNGANEPHQRAAMTRAATALRDSIPSLSSTRPTWLRTVQ